MQKLDTEGPLNSERKGLVSHMATEQGHSGNLTPGYSNNQVEIGHDNEMMKNRNLGRISPRGL